MENAPRFVGQGLLDDLNSPQSTGFGASTPTFAFHLPDRSVTVHEPPALTANSQHSLDKSPSLFSNISNHPASLQDASPTPPKKRAEKGKEAQNQDNRVFKPLSKSQEKKQTQRLVKAFAALSHSGQPTPKQHDYAVWQVPDVAFTQGQNSAPPAGSANSWDDLKAKAQASVKSAKKKKPTNESDASNGLTKQANASSNQASSEPPAEPKKRKPRTRRAEKRANAAAKTQASSGATQSNPQATKDPNDSIAARMKLRHERNRDLEVLRANAMDSIGMRIRGRSGRESEENSRVQHDASRGDYYRPHDHDYQERDSWSVQVGDFYRPSYPETVTRSTADHYRTESERQRAPADPRDNPSTGMTTTGFSAPTTIQTSYTANNDPRVNATAQNQYYGLGQGIWPLNVPSHVAASQGASSSDDAGHAFNQFHPGSNGQFVHNNVGPYNFQLQGTGSVLNQNTGLNPSSSFPLWDENKLKFEHPNNALALNQSMWFNPVQCLPAWSGTRIGFGAPPLLAPHVSTQTSSIHSSAAHNLVDSHRKLDPMAAEFTVPPKPTGLAHDAVILSAAPEPSSAYLKQAANEPHRLKAPQPLLIISDVNGTLISRKPHNRRSFTARPALGAFMKFIMNSSQIQPANPSTPTAKPYTFMIWTSARPTTTNHVVATLFDKAQLAAIAAIWSRNTLGLSAEQYHGKTQVYKRLTRVWRSPAVQATHPLYAYGERWSQRNTLLLDDSVAKAWSEPFNLVHVPELTPAALVREAAQRDPDAGVLRRVAAYIDEARWYADVSAYVKAHPFSMGGSAGAEPSAAAGMAAGDAGGLKDDGEVSDDDDVMVMDPGAAGVPLNVESGAEAGLVAGTKKPGELDG